MTVLKARINGAWVPITGSAQPWNSAWGIVAVGSWKAGISGIDQPHNAVISDPLTYTMTVGRRYRVVAAMRAIGMSVAGQSLWTFIRRDGTDVADAYSTTPPAAMITPGRVDFLVDGDGASHSWTVHCGVGSGNFKPYLDEPSCFFYIEDIGPVVQAPAIPNPTPPWINMTTFSNGWSNFGGSRAPTSYRKIGDVVELRLAVKGGTASTSITTLPVGYRPPYILDFTGREGGNSYVQAGFAVTTTGSVEWYGTQANNALVCLNCSFSTTP